MQLDAHLEAAPKSGAGRTALRARSFSADDGQRLASLAADWPSARLLSPRLVAGHHGSLEGLYRALATPGYLFGGAWVDDGHGATLGWMVLVRHHQRAGYAGTARLVFDLDVRVAEECAREQLGICRNAPGTAGLRVLIGFSDDDSSAITRLFAALGFEPTGTLATGADARGCLHAHALEITP